MKDEDIIAAGYEAWNRGDLEALVAFAHPDVEWHGSGLFPGLEASYHGHDGIRRLFADLTGPFSSFSIHVEEIRRQGDDFRVHIRMRGVGAGSGAAVEVPIINEVLVVDGLVRRVRSRLIQ